MKKLGVILITSLLCYSATGQSAEQIIKKSHEVMKVNSFEAVSTLTIADSRGNERIRKCSMASKVFDDGTEKRVIKFLSPAEVKGTGILIFDNEDKSDDMWIYLPSLRQTRRIVSREKSKAFMGSEFSNADMTAPALSDFNYNLEGIENVNNVECWKISSIPVNTDLEDEYGYSLSVAWIGKNDYIVRKTEYLDFEGELFKTIKTLDFKLLDQASGRYMVTDMNAENYNNGRKSRLKMDQVQLADTDNDYFTVAFLER